VAKRIIIAGQRYTVLLVGVRTFDEMPYEIETNTIAVRHT
jgi:hypothetical protein